VTITASVKKRTIQTPPAIDTYLVTVLGEGDGSGRGIWEEPLATKDEVRAFFKGMQAALACGANIHSFNVPEIPT
jgi:hypothetical protein